MIGLLISASVLILVVIALRWILRGRISLTLQYAMWALVALRLLIPIEIGSSSLSLQNFFAEEPTRDSAIITQAPQKDPATIPDPIPSVSDPTQSTPSISTPSQSTTTDLPVENNTPSLPGMSYEPIPQGITISWKQILTLIWAPGAGAMALWFLIVNLRFHRKVKKNAHSIEVEGYPFPVFVNEELSSPCLVGLLRPRVYIPRETDGRTLRHILIHEQTHHRHLDPLWAWVRGLCLCLYWFHPLVWWAAILSRQDCELACDEGALSRLGEQERIPYGDTLLSMISHASRPQELFRTATTMAASKRQLKERVEMIVKQPKKLWFALLCLLLVIAFTVGCTFTGANREEFISPTSRWCSSFHNIIARSEDNTYDGDIESLQRMTDLLSEKLDALETLDPESVAYALLGNTLQVADLLEKEGGNSFFDLPQWEQEALLELWYILGNANYATSEEEYLQILESHAGSWLDPWIFGSTGHILPIENPILPPSMPPKETTESTEPTQPTQGQKTDPADTTVEVLSQEGPYRIPKLTLDTALGEKINTSITGLFSDTTKYRSIDFSWAKEDSLLSLVVFGESKDGEMVYRSYNIDLKTGTEATTAQIFSLSYYHLEGNVCRELSKVFARDLYARYKETGSLSYDEQTDANFYANLIYEKTAVEIPCWFDENGDRWAAAEYCSPDGEIGMKVVPLNATTEADFAPMGNFVYEEITFQTPTDEYFPDAYSLTLPFLLIEGNRAAEINGMLLYRYHSRYSEIRYSIADKDDLVSIAVTGQHAEMPYAVSTVYNLSKSTGMDAPKEDVYAMGGLHPATYKNHIRKVLLNACLNEIPENIDDPQYTPIIIEETISDYNISQCTPYLTEDGKLWIVGTVYFLVGGEAAEMVLPVTDCQFSDRYYNYLSSRQYSINDYLQLLPTEQPDLMPFIEAAQRQDISPEALFSLYLRQLTEQGDSAAWQEVETTADSETLYLYGGILHEIPMNHTDATTLKEKIADQFAYWQETGTLDDPSVGNINAETEPYYQLRTVVVDGRNANVSFRLKVNGREVGCYDVKHRILFLQIDQPSIPASEPVEVKLEALEGALPTDSVYLGITSNISGAR